jgi:glutamate/tyrosine decarboxylase-like PLP-dependent enzyme
MIERCCRLATRMADGLRAGAPDIEILNKVVLDQVLVRFPGAAGDAEGADARTREVIARVQSDGTCWLAGTTWHGMAAMRVSIVNWSTTEEDVDRSVAAILEAVRGVGSAG